MKTNDDSTTRVLSIYPTTRGFGYSIFEGARNPIDWGVNSVRKDKNKTCIEKIERLIDFYQPEVVVSEDYKGEGSRRCLRIRKLIDDITNLCDKKNVVIKKYSRSKITDVFDDFGSFNKHQIAQTIANWLPPLAPYLPPPRKPWMSEDYRMAIFDSISLTLTYYYIDE